MPNRIVSIIGDEDTNYLYGQLIGAEEAATKTYFNGVLIAKVGGDASGGSINVFIEGAMAHRIGDFRACGGVTDGPIRKLIIGG